MDDLLKQKNKVGRPREYDRLQVGKDFVEWAKTHSDCLTVPHFTTAYGLTSTRVMAWCQEDPEFLEYYIAAKEFIGINRLNATRISSENEIIHGKKALDKTIYLRHVNNFDPDMRKADREEKIFENNLKKEVAERASQDSVNMFEKLIEQISNAKK